MRMKTKFVDKDEDSDYCFHLVLSESQIKSWFSSETGHRKKAAVNRVIEKGFTGLSQSIQDNEEGGHDQNEGGRRGGRSSSSVSSPSSTCSPSSDKNMIS
jgi:hypothetical protein